jgi:superfamily II DNA or RNA helicase
MMFATLGHPNAKISRRDVQDASGIMTPNVIVRTVPSPIVEGNDYHQIMENDVIPNEGRSNMIAEDVVREAKAGNFCIVINTRKIYCEILFDKISRYWNKTGIANGDFSDKHNQNQVARLENNEITVLITTFDLLGEGFDVKKLNRGFIALPFRERNRVEQAVGRIQRTCEGKKDALLYDYVDMNIGILKNQFRTRSFIYRMLGMKTMQ